MRSLRFSVSVSCFVFLLSVLSLQSAASQEHAPPFRRITIKDGLPQSTVNAVVQDKTGFIWFGTQSGLVRYDGYAFQVFKHQPDDSTSISDNVIVDLMVDSMGILWVGTYNGGLNVWDSRTGMFRRYPLPECSSGPAAAATISSLFQDSKGRRWIGTWGGGLLLVEGEFPGPISFRRFRHDPQIPSSLADDRVADIAQTPDGSVWIAEWTALSKVEESSGFPFSFINYPLLTNPAVRPDSCLWTLTADSAGCLWLGLYECGLAYFDPARAKFEMVKHAVGKQGGVSCLLRDRLGRMWIGTTGSGLFLSSGDNRSLRQFRKSADDPESISDNSIRCLYEDRGGVIWIGTSSNGVCSYFPRREQFKHVKHAGPDGTSLGGDIVRAFAVDELGGLWVGMSGGGADYLPRGSSEFRHYKHNPADERTLPSDNVRALCVRKNGDLWVGTDDAGIGILKKSARRFLRLRHAPSSSSSLARNTVTCILEDQRGVVWVGTAGGGLDQWDDRTASFVHHRAGVDSSTLSGDWIWSLCEDRQGRLWIGTWGKGLSILDRERNSFRRIAFEPGDTASLPNNTVLCIAEDLEGSVWVGTEGGGLCRVDPLTGRARRITSLHGLNEKVVCSVVPSRTGVLWITGMNGLAALDLRNGDCRVYTESDGLQSNEFSPGASIRLPDGTICIGGANGFNMFRETLQPSYGAPPPALVISAIKVFEQPVTPDMFDGNSGRLVLEYDENSVSFEFAALDYSAPELTRYTYMLEGQDTKWIDGGPRRYASYTRLKGGDYVFRVRARGGDGDWGAGEAQMRFTVVPAVWNRWWFHLSAVALIALAVRLHLRYRMNQLLALERMRVRIASDLHDDIGSTLTKIAVQSEVIRTTKDAGTAIELAKHIGLASRETITSLSDIVWSIDARRDTVGNLLDRMKEFAHEVLSSRHVDVAFSELGLDHKSPMTAELRQNIYMIFKEAVNNIARHSNASEARIALENGPEEFRMTISDNGTSWREPADTARRGLRNMEMRAARIRGTLTLETGSGVTIRLVTRPMRGK